MTRIETYPDDVWYFAYGSNLDIDQKQDRTGPIREARRCRLPGHRLAFNKRSKGGQVCANIVPHRGGEVWGVAYRCRPGTLEQMDTYEGVASGHYRQVSVEVVTEAGERLRATTYVAEPGYLCPEARPSQQYAEKIVRGARRHQLPASYVEELVRLAGVHDDTPE